MPTASPTVFIAKACTLNTQGRACAINVRKHERSSRAVELIKGCVSCSSALHLFITLTLALRPPLLTLLYSYLPITDNCPTSCQSYLQQIAPPVIATMATIEDLTPELVGHVASFMDDSTLQDFRLASKDCAAKTDYEFTNRVSKLSWLVSRYSLARLKLISRTNRLAKTIDTLRLQLHDFRFDKGMKIPLFGVAGTVYDTKTFRRLCQAINGGFMTEDLRNLQHQAFEMSLASFWNGEDYDQLCHIVGQLKSLQRIDLTQGKSDGWAMEAPYEIVTLEQNGLGLFRREREPSFAELLPPPMRLRGRDASMNEATHNFWLVLHVLAVTQKPIRTLCAFRDACGFCGIDLRRLPPLSQIDPHGGLEPALSMLRNLDLTFRRGTRRFLDTASMQTGPIISFSLKDFTALAPSLQRLSLDLGTQNCHHMLEGCSMPNLGELELRRCSISLVQLLDVVLHHRQTLEQVRLEEIRLLDGGWQEFVGTVHRSTPDLILDLTTILEPMTVDGVLDRGMACQVVGFHDYDHQTFRCKLCEQGRGRVPPGVHVHERFVASDATESWIDVNMAGAYRASWQADGVELNGVAYFE